MLATAPALPLEPTALRRTVRPATAVAGGRPAPTAAAQASFDDLLRPERSLAEVTFVVVDLETTGGSPADCDITEIGAVKVRGGEVLGSFATLVRPSAPIPPFICVLTGITDQMVASAPRPSAVLPAFLEFARGCVLVAHNAPFDLGFLRAGCERLGLGWPRFESLDTARLARRVLTRDEAPDCKLATLARVFRVSEQPCHRAMADARATVEVLHGLFERLGSFGVTTLEELKEFSAAVPAAVRRKRHLADALPSAPGVYLFRGGDGQVLYVGTSRNVRARVRSYFTASEPRTRMVEMVQLAERVDAVPCAHALEAEVRELRLIAEHKPRYNRRSRFPERSVWLKLTREPFPRIAQVRQVRDDGAVYLGPLGSRHVAESAALALAEAFGLRQCAGRLAISVSRSPCALWEMGRCGAPCAGHETRDAYAERVAAADRAIRHDPTRLVETLRRRMHRLADAGRYEDAAVQRDRISAFVRAAARRQRLGALAAVRELVAAAPAAGGWELVVIRCGRLVASGFLPTGAAVRPYVDALRATAEAPTSDPGPLPSASAEEMECLLRWLERDGVRLVDVDGTWCSPAAGAGGRREWLALGERRAGGVPTLGERQRTVRPVSRPPRALVGAG